MSLFKTAKSRLSLRSSAYGYIMLDALGSQLVIGCWLVFVFAGHPIVD
jgi:hypothetical protein